VQNIPEALTYTTMVLFENLSKSCRPICVYSNFKVWWMVASWLVRTFVLLKGKVQITDKLYHTMLYGVHLAWARFELTTLVVIGTDCIGSSKSNYHTFTTTTDPNKRYTIIWTKAVYYVAGMYLLDFYSLIFNLIIVFAFCLNYLVL
jgi:hypothetical protein